jgi:hypothetical protein
MNTSGHAPTVWVRDEGQRYVAGRRVEWIRGGNHRLVADRNGQYEIVSAEPDPAMTPERWLRVQLRQV